MEALESWSKIEEALNFINRDMGGFILFPVFLADKEDYEQ